MPTLAATNVTEYDSFTSDGSIITRELWPSAKEFTGHNTDITTVAQTPVNPFPSGNTTIVPEEDVLLGNSSGFTCYMPPPIVTNPPIVINKNASDREDDILVYKYGTTIVWVINGEKHKGTIVGDYVEENKGGITKKSPI